MKTINDLVADKIYEIVNYGLSKLIKPDIKIDKINELDEKSIKQLKQKYNIEGVILDVDETLRKEMNKIPKCNEQWIENLQKELKVIVVSNGIDKNVGEFFKLKDIDYISFAHKPLKKNLIKACEKMNIHPENVLVIGDSLFQDIHGGNKLNMKTALVKNVQEDELER